MTFEARSEQSGSTQFIHEVNVDTCNVQPVNKQFTVLTTGGATVLKVGYETMLRMVLYQ